MEFLVDLGHELGERCVLEHAPVAFQVALPSDGVKLVERADVRDLVKVRVVLDLRGHEERPLGVGWPVDGKAFLHPRVPDAARVRCASHPEGDGGEALRELPALRPTQPAEHIAVLVLLELRQLVEAAVLMVYSRI